MARGFFGILKLIAFVLILPVIIAVIIGFHRELHAVAGDGRLFWWGVIAYTIFHLFIFTPQDIYRFWQGVFMEICSFAGNAANMIVQAVPIITTVLLLIYFLAVVIFDQRWAQETMIFLTGFTLALHVILSAQELYESDETHLKGHYLLNLGVIFIVNMLILAGLLDLAFKKFSFMSFWDAAFQSGDYLYTKILNAAGMRW